MLGQPWGVSDGAEGKVDLRREQIQRALDAGAHARIDDSGVALEAFGAAIHDGLDAGLVEDAVLVVVDHGEDHAVDPPPGHDGVQTADDNSELLVEGLVKVLDLAVVGLNVDARDAFVDESGGNFGLKTEENQPV